MTKKVRIVTIDYGSTNLILKNHKSLMDHPQVEHIIIDNNTHNLGFASGCNSGAKGCRCLYLLFLNPDAQMSIQDLMTLVDVADQHEEPVLMAPQLVDDEGNPYLSYTRIVHPGNALVVLSGLNKWFPNNPISRKYWYADESLVRSKQVESVSGAAMLIKTEDFWSIGGFDERFFMYWEDMDLCFRLSKAGGIVWYEASVQVRHSRGGSSTNLIELDAISKQSLRYFLLKHYGWMGLGSFYARNIFSRWGMFGILVLLAGLLVWG